MGSAIRCYWSAADPTIIGGRDLDVKTAYSSIPVFDDPSQGLVPEVCQMTAQGYWTRLMEQRASRRAVVIGGAGLAGSAALLAACGGSSDKGDSGGAATANDKVYRDTKEETAVKGGAYKFSINADLSSLDPYRQSAASVSTEIGTFAMNRLMQWKQGPGIDPYKYEVAPDLATGYEISNGGLTYTFKLRQGVKFHNVAPVNGRLFDSEDVTKSYQRFKNMPGVGNAIGSGVGSPQYGNSFAGLVDSVTAPDANTVVFKLTKPNAAFLNILATFLFFWIYPKEVDSGYDPLKTVIGTGPWIVSQYLPSQRIEYKRNPDYYEQGLPNMDTVTCFFITEAAQELAQFQANAIFQYTPSQFGDLKAILTAQPDVRVLPAGIGGSQGTGFNRDNPNSPFLKDVRVRQAYSLVIDRDLILQSFNEVDKWSEFGVQREYRLTNFIEPNLNTWWVDPRSKEMGEAAQWYEHDVKKAKQLMVAAGYADGFDTIQHYSINNTNDRYLNCQPLLNQWLAEIGIRGKLSGEDYASVFNPHSWHGEGDGWVSWGWQGFGDPGQQLDYLFGPASTRNQMGTNDPKFNQMYDQQQAELDTTKRKSQLLEIYKYMQTENRHVGWSYGCVNNYTLYQPQVRNNAAYANAEAGGQRFLHWWLKA
jgi:peptide/nickel transport system substrate-binding protein